METIKYSTFNPKNGKDTIKTKEVLSVKKWNEKEKDIKLKDGKTICVGFNNTELYGKNGDYLAIVEIIE
jgi:hypothetical protein